MSEQVYDLTLNKRMIGTYATAADAEEAKRRYVKTYGPPAGTFFIYERPPVAVPGPASAPEHVCKPEQTDKRTVTCPVCHAVYVLDDAATSDERSYVDG